MSPFLWAVLCALVWGIVPILEKLGLAKVPVMAGLFYRCLGVLMGTVVLYFWQMDAIKEIFPKEGRGIIFLMAGGILASVVGQIFFYHALKSGEASQVVPIAAAYPVVSFILGIFFLGEQFTLAKLSGLLFIGLGIFLLK